MKRKLIAATSLMLLTIGAVFVLLPAHTSADFDMYDRALNYSYYSNTFEASTGDLLFDSSPDIPYQGITADWPTVPMNVNSFIASVESRLNSPTDYNSARAAAMINMMMGINGDDSQYSTPNANRWENGVAVAKANLGQWETLVRAYNAAGDVDWNGYDTGVNEKDWVGLNNASGTKLPDVVPVQLNEVDDDEAIIFNNPDGTQFTIKKKCANLTGDVEPLKQIVTPTPTPTPTPAPTPIPTPPPAPYFQATGGDVVAGASFAANAATPCSAATHTTTAGIVSWNDDGSPDYAGAGGQYAALAMNYIQGFVSGQGSGGTDSLSFANVNTAGSVSPTNGLFGGMFGDAPCADYWNTKPATTILTDTTVDVGSLANGAYMITGNVTLTGTTMAAGKQVTLYVDGNVAINGNIAYPSNTTYSSRAQIPSFELIAHGSIFIDASVTALNGTYAAIPNADAGSKADPFNAPIAGTISTCSTGFATYDPTKILTNNMAAACANRLTVTGSVIANQLWLLRDYGSLASKQPAEVFDYTPESWLAPSAANSGSAGEDYQSIVGLPPIL